MGEPERQPDAVRFGKLIVDIRSLPEVLFEIRRELARLLREEAGADSNPAVAKRLREIAGQFEAGVSGPDGREGNRRG